MLYLLNGQLKALNIQESTDAFITMMDNCRFENIDILPEEFPTVSNRYGSQIRSNGVTFSPEI